MNRLIAAAGELLFKMIAWGAVALGLYRRGGERERLKAAEATAERAIDARKIDDDVNAIPAADLRGRMRDDGDFRL